MCVLRLFRKIESFYLILVNGCHSQKKKRKENDLCAKWRGDTIKKNKKRKLGHTPMMPRCGHGYGHRYRDRGYDTAVLTI